MADLIRNYPEMGDGGSWADKGDKEEGGDILFSLSLT